jgi:hypothetical protein
MMWGSDYPHSESRLPRSRKILEGAPEDEQAKIAAAAPPACTILTRRGWPALLEEPIYADRRGISERIDEGYRIELD